jgi:hypothetical protein
MTGPGRYACTGDVTLTSAEPIVDAALALREAGHPDSDEIVTTCGDCTVMPATIGRILAPRRLPLRSEVERQQRLG